VHVRRHLALRTTIPEGLVLQRVADGRRPAAGVGGEDLHGLRAELVGSAQRTTGQAARHADMGAEQRTGGPPGHNTVNSLALAGSLRSSLAGARSMLTHNSVSRVMVLP